jgi:transcriptional regulator GlxA family with amidase domain
MIRVVLALYPRALATSLALPMDVLQAASQAASIENRGRRQLRFQLAAVEKKPITIVGGLEISPQITLDQVSPCDMLLLPAMWRNPQPVLQSQREWLALLPELAAAGTTICSIGTASCFLAASGLLDGVAATTHWAYMDEFRRRYPAVKLKRRHLITQSGNLYCAGSVNSGADLMVHLIEEWFGQRIARAVESQFSPEIRRPFRAHAYQSIDDSAHHDEMVLSAQQWLQDQLHESVSMAELADSLGCSTRTLNRRFKNVVGQTPGAYLRGQRLTAARELLRATNLSVGEVAWQVGLHDVSYFTSLFQRHTGFTPAKYRASVRGKLFSPTR